MRRSACLTVALAVLVSLTVASAGAVGATPDQGGAYVPAARGEDPGPNDRADDRADKADRKSQKEELCPQEKWVIALPIEGLACILLLPKPPAEGERGGGDGGGGAGGRLQ
ncbi:MAG: hypothetical protein M3357_03375 [Actinomycetota bacterium]|nr:hypothetical protein [Actinomycetota bacterium]